ncbi:unnamed protein product [Closterium sp. NIES-54]
MPGSGGTHSTSTALTPSVPLTKLLGGGGLTTALLLLALTTTGATPLCKAATSSATASASSATASASAPSATAATATAATAAADTSTSASTPTTTTTPSTASTTTATAPASPTSALAPLAPAKATEGKSGEGEHPSKIGVRGSPREAPTATMLCSAARRRSSRRPPPPPSPPPPPPPPPPPTPPPPPPPPQPSSVAPTAAAPHFLWPFAVQYAAHQLNLQPRVSLPETSPTLRWTGKVGDASAFRVWGSRAFVRDLSADKLSPRAVPCVFLGFPTHAPGWQFYHPTSRRVLSSQDVTFDESVPYYRLFPYRTAPLPPPPLFLAPGPPPVDPLPPQGPAPSGVSQVDAVEPVEVAVDSGAARGAEPVGAGSGGTEPGGAESGGAESRGAEPGGAESGGAEPGGAEPGGTEPRGVEPGGAESARVASRSPSSRRELLSPQELREWFARRWSRAAGAGGPPVAPGPGGARNGGNGAIGTGGAAAAAGVGPTRASGAAGAGATRGVGAGVGPTGASEAAGAGAIGGFGAGDGPVGGIAGATGGTGAVGPAGVGAVGAGGAIGTGAATGGPGAVPVGTGDPAQPRPYFVPLLEQVLGLPPSLGPAPPLECPQPVQSQSQFQPVSTVPAPSPYAGPTGGLAERREPASCPASLVRTTRTSRRAPRPRPPAVPGTHQMTQRPSTAPLRVPLPSPPESSLPVLADPASDSLRAASPTVARLLSTVVTDPSFESTAASALVAELVDFAACCRLDYAASLVAESASVCPPSVGGECALSTDVLEDRQEEFQCFDAALPHLVSTLIAPEGDPDAPDIPTPRSYAEAIEGPFSSQWQSAMDAEMASWKSTGTYVDEVPPPGANIVSGMWIFRVKRPPGSPPVFKARYVARGFSQRQGVDYFQTFSPTPKMTTLRVLLHVAAQRDYF